MDAIAKKAKGKLAWKKNTILYLQNKTKNEETTMKYLQSKTMLVTRTNKTLLIWPIKNVFRTSE
jgi:hypothetical protein